MDQINNKIRKLLYLFYNINLKIALNKIDINIGQF